MQFTKLIGIISENIAHKLQSNIDVRTVRMYDGVKI